MSERKRARELGINVGVLPPGPLNAITDVTGVLVGQQTVWQGEAVRTGVTAILPHGGNLFQEKVPAAIHVGNGFGKLAGALQVQELGELETAIALTNTLSVAAALNGLIQHTLSQPGNEQVFSVNAVVGETNDGFLNDIRGQHVTEADVQAALAAAAGGPVAEGSVGAGTGTSCFGFKGGIGTASRRLPAGLPTNTPGYTVGVLVQSNYGGLLTINGQPVGQQLGHIPFKDELNQAEAGSCM
ncbi:MAG: P1 family peptidase, partial [Anaerolineales bacterium]|nr:P1 family peptidase [Anaerolineales bacterium]